MGNRVTASLEVWPGREVNSRVDRESTSCSTLLSLRCLESKIGGGGVQGDQVSIVRSK